MPEDDVDIMVEQDSDGLWAARIIHRPTGTMKISAECSSREEAISEATQGLFELLKERLQGLGE